MRNLFISLLLVVANSNVLAVDVADVKAEISYKDQMINQAGNFVERTVNMIATPFLSDRDVECLARNIFYESGGEPTEGKIAVGVVTLNRTQDGRFGKSVCEVVKSRTVVAKTREVKQTEVVRVGYFGRPEKITTTHRAIEQVPVCQFSWVCAGYARQPNPTDERWVESREIAQRLADGEFPEYQAKYANALFFHASAIRPVWAKTKKIVSRTGHHIFYE